MKYMWKYLKPYRPAFIIGPLFKLLEAVLELTMPVYMAHIVDTGIPSGDNGYIIKMGLMMLATAAVGLISAIICQYSASIASQGFGTSLRNGIFKKVLGLSFSQIDEFGASTLTNRIINDVNQLQLAVAMSIRLVIRAPFICIGSVIATLMIDVKLGLIVLAAFPLFSIALFIVMRKTFPLYSKVQARLDSLAAKVRESLSGVRIIRAFAMEDADEKQFDKKNEELGETAAKVGGVSSVFNPITSFIMNATIIAIVWFGGFRVNAGELSSGEILAFISYVTQMLTVLIVVANLVIIMTRASASLKRVGDVFRIPDDPSESEKSVGTAESGDICVEFKNVSFGYHSTGEKVFENISFTLKKGETLGIVGSTGSGKTTLCNLVSRYYMPDSGEILLNGRNVADYPASELRRIIGVVPQKVQLFSGTVEENISFGGSADHEQVVSAAKIAQADGFITSLKKGYNSRVEKGGTNFSGGQRQRLAIARAIAAAPDLLILDDSSSALDYATDAKLRAALSSQLAGLTSIVVSQRVRSVKNMDKILVLDDGHIAGIGRHDELIKTCPEYIEIAKLSDGNGGGN